MRRVLLPTAAVLAVLAVTAVVPALAGGTNGPDPIPSLRYADFAPQMWGPDGQTFNWGLFAEAIDAAIPGGSNGPDPIPSRFLNLHASGQAPAFYTPQWAGWNSMDEAKWILLCTWAAAVVNGDVQPFPAELPQ